MLRLRAPRILKETPDWLVIDKPAGWHTVRVRDSDGAPTVESWLVEARPAQAGLEESGLVQRLDRWTSGCLLAGRTPEALATLRARISEARNSQARNSQTGDPAVIRKSYLALLSPGLAPDGAWELHFTSRHRGSSRVTVGRRGDDSSLGRCRWRVLRCAEARSLPRRNATLEPASVRALRPGPPTRQQAAAPPQGFDLVEVELFGPGRRHQIRAGFAFFGHPLAGDGLYGGSPIQVGADEPPWIDRPALHASVISLDGHAVEAESPVWLPPQQPAVPLSGHAAATAPPIA